MEHLLTEIKPLISDYGLLIIFFGVMVEGTTMILISGILCYLGLLTVTQTIPVAIIGAIIGDNLWYFLGQRYMTKIVKHFSSIASNIEKLSTTVHKRGNLLAFSGRFIYGAAILFPLTLSYYRYSYKKFILYDTVGVSLWTVLGIWLGYFLGTGIEKYIGEIKKVEDLFFIIIGIIITVFISKRVLKRNQSSTEFITL